MAASALSMMSEVAALGRDDLQRFLRKQRWFADTGGAMRVHNVAPLGRNLLFVMVRIEAQPHVCTYQVPVAVCRLDSVPPHAVLRRLSSSECLADAMHDEASRTRLLQALLGEETWRGIRGAWQAACFNRDGLSEITRSHLHSGEQSNSSVVYDRKAIFKLFRRLEPGPNPDLEMGAFLANEQHCDVVPALHGWLRYTDTSGAMCDAGMLQAYVADAEDGWTHATARLAAHVREVPMSPQMPWCADARALGASTRVLHAALNAADDADFKPIPANAAQGEAWVQQCLQAATASLDMLQDHLETLPTGVAAMALQLLQQRPQVCQRIAAHQPFIASDAGVVTRHHGDYHLGQVLRTQSGDFKILDFEGEPLRPLADRRERQSPLRDVAGMLRSFAYAAASVSQEYPGAAVVCQAWQSGACASFWAGYTAGETPWLPHDPAICERLVRLFKTEKAWYELRYELTHRPAWALIPMQGLLQEMGAG